MLWWSIPSQARMVGEGVGRQRLLAVRGRGREASWLCEARGREEDTWQVQVRAMEALQVMRLLLKVQVFVLLLKALLKAKEVFSLSSPLTRPQTTMPQTRPGGA